MSKVKVKTTQKKLHSYLNMAAIAFAFIKWMIKFIDKETVDDCSHAAHRANDQMSKD